MIVTPIKTPIVHPEDDIFQLIRSSLKSLPEKSVLVVTSKVVGLAENCVVPVVTASRKEKHDLVRQEAEYYTEPSSSQYDIMLTIKNQTLAINAGIDESNVDGQYVLFPKDPQASVNKIWEFLRQEYNLEQVGVVMSDSKTFPLKWGVIGTSLAHCGFKALKDCIGKPDLFGHEMQMTKMNIAEGVATAAVLEMGETNESTPLCLVKEVTHIEFQDHSPSEKELGELAITMEDDVYEPVLSKVGWKKGKSSRLL